MEIVQEMEMIYAIFRYANTGSRNIVRHDCNILNIEKDIFNVKIQLSDLFFDSKTIHLHLCGRPVHILNQRSAILSTPWSSEGLGGLQEKFVFYLCSPARNNIIFWRQFQHFFKKKKRLLLIYIIRVLNFKF